MRKKLVLGPENMPRTDPVWVSVYPLASWPTVPWWISPVLLYGGDLSGFTVTYLSV
jgi:hypothetical protein